MNKHKNQTGIQYADLPNLFFQPLRMVFNALKLHIIKIPHLAVKTP